jgi:hypothetical protein
MYTPNVISLFHIGALVCALFLNCVLFAKKNTFSGVIALPISFNMPIVSLSSFGKGGGSDIFWPFLIRFFTHTRVYIYI